MPTQIDCPECGGRMEVCQDAGLCDHDGSDCTSRDNCGEYEPVRCPNPDCKDGKITVYTEAEMKELRDIVGIYESYINNTLRIDSDEREACAVLGDGQVRYSYEVAEAIRCRGE